MARPETATAQLPDLSTDFCPGLKNLNKTTHRKVHANQVLAREHVVTDLVVPCNTVACGSFCLRLQLREGKDV